MSNRYIGLAVGFVLTLIITTVITMTLGGAAEDPRLTGETVVLDNNIVEEIRLNSEGLVNYGDLPKTSTAEEIERSNPFDSY